MKTGRFAAVVLATLLVYAAFNSGNMRAQTATEDDDVELLVPIPNPPQSITKLDERCNYILEHFWDNFNFKTALSAKQRFNKTFGTFISFTPYATADTVHMAIDRLIKSVGKTKANNLLELCAVAEHWTYGPEAEYQSDELYLPFLKSVVENKKVKGAEKERYKAQYDMLSNSSIGCRVADFDIVLPDATKTSLYEVKAPHVLLMFVDPECMDCRLAKARLSADFIIKSLIDAKVLDVVAVYPGDANDVAWVAEAPAMPKEWIVGASDQVDRVFDIDPMPAIYYLDSNKVVKAKKVPVDNILAAFRSLLKTVDVNNVNK